VLEDPPNRMPQIPGDALYFREAPGVSSLLAKRERIAEAKACLAQGILGVQAVASIGRSTELHVQAHLLVEILQPPPARDEEPQASEHRQAICRTRAIAPVTR
jgi:hypothetical protein